MDSEYWKKQYQGKWAAGVRRAETIAKLVDSWGFDVHAFGFLANSTEYSKESPDEKGTPDWEVSKDKDVKVLLEVTGTKNSRGKDDVWIRDDKFEYAEKHPESDCWVGHIIEGKNLIRFMKLENKENFPLQKIQLTVMETYRVIPEGNSVLLSPEEFKKYLESKV